MMMLKKKTQYKYQVKEFKEKHKPAKADNLQQCLLRSYFWKPKVFKVKNVNPSKNSTECPNNFS